MKRRHRAQAVARTTFEEYIGFLEAIAPTHWWAKITEHDMEFVSTIERTKREYLQQGMQQGFQHGREEGVIFTLRRAIARLATSRGLELTSESQQRLATCTSSEQLEQWLTHVGTTTVSPVTLDVAKS